METQWVIWDELIWTSEWNVRHLVTHLEMWVRSERGNFHYLMFTLVDRLISFNGQQVKQMTRTHRARPCRIHFCIKSLKCSSHSQRKLPLRSLANTISGNSTSKIVEKSGAALFFLCLPFNLLLLCLSGRLTFLGAHWLVSLLWNQAYSCHLTN